MPGTRLTIRIAGIPLTIALTIGGYFLSEGHLSAELRIIVLIVGFVLVVLEIGLAVTDYRREQQDAHSGTLIGPPRVLFSPTEQHPELEIGESGSVFKFAGNPGEPMFVIADTSLTVVMDRGSVKVSAKIFDRTGALVAELYRNDWSTNRNALYDRNYSANALEVRDNTGDIVLQVKVIEDRIQLQGIFYGTGGHGCALAEVPEGKGKGAIMVPLPGHPRPKIRPLFRYPSERYLGQLA